MHWIALVCLVCGAALSHAQEAYVEQPFQRYLYTLTITASFLAAYSP
ncbi:MAG: hypothetical protein HC902_15030 [Calothrix sp. SM1_5_4]|nr:hypothetical protein [Calothrix sp. SM1_5_4]